jgi:hypothetical protein
VRASSRRRHREVHHALALARGHFDVVCHAHRSYVSLSALEPALGRHDLSIVEVEQLDLHGGSVRAMAVHKARAGTVQPEVSELRAAERDWGLHTAAGFRQLAGMARQVRQGLWAFLSEARAAGASVVGYGAPSRGITLLNFCGVSREQLAFTVDRSPAKQGRFLPGSHLPVLAPAAIEATRPDYVLILPWALATEIVEQMSCVRQWGGRFVVAVPELRILA